MIAGLVNPVSICVIFIKLNILFIGEKAAIAVGVIAILCCCCVPIPTGVIIFCCISKKKGKGYSIFSKYNLLFI